MGLGGFAGEAVATAVVAVAAAAEGFRGGKAVVLRLLNPPLIVTAGVEAVAGAVASLDTAAAALMLLLPACTAAAPTGLLATRPAHVDAKEPAVAAGPEAAAAAVAGAGTGTGRAGMGAVAAAAGEVPRGDGWCEPPTE